MNVCKTPAWVRPSGVKWIAGLVIKGKGKARTKTRELKSRRYQGRTRLSKHSGVSYLHYLPDMASYRHVALLACLLPRLWLWVVAGKLARSAYTHAVGLVSFHSSSVDCFPSVEAEVDDESAIIIPLVPGVFFSPKGTPKKLYTSPKNLTYSGPVDLAATSPEINLFFHFPIISSLFDRERGTHVFFFWPPILVILVRVDFSVMCLIMWLT